MYLSSSSSDLLEHILGRDIKLSLLINVSVYLPSQRRILPVPTTLLVKNKSFP